MISLESDFPQTEFIYSEPMFSKAFTFQGEEFKNQYKLACKESIYKIKLLRLKVVGSEGVEKTNLLKARKTNLLKVKNPQLTLLRRPILTSQSTLTTESEYQLQRTT